MSSARIKATQAQSAPAEVLAATGRARVHLIGLQQPGGWWKGVLRTNVTMDAEDLLMRQVPRHPARRRARAGGALDPLAAGARTAPGPLSPAAPATSPPRSRPYAALRLAVDEPSSPHLRRAAAFVVAGGGIEATRVFTRIWLALFGEWSWDDLPAMPPELVLLPSWVPLNVYDWGAGRASRSCRSRSWPRCARCDRCRSRWPSCTWGSGDARVRAASSEPVSPCWTRR